MKQSSYLPNPLVPYAGLAWTGQGRPAARRGVLLLVVLSMLTLFMMIGVAFLLAATRAKESARVFSRLTFAGDEARLPAKAALEKVLMTVIRDRTATGDRPKELGGVAGTFKFESLLSDRYGRALSATSGDGRRLEGTVNDVTVSGPLIRATFTATAGTPPTNAATLNGRIITFLPTNGRPTSHRIIRANGSTLWLAPSLVPVTFKASSNGTEAVINGREFSAVPAATPILDTDNENEAWDGFGDAGNAHDLWLAHLEPATVSTSNCVRPSYFTAMPAADLDGDGILDQCDNDGDGVNDGVFLDFGFPPTRNSAGDTVNTHASVLIVDLDGRFNVNAHDSMAPYLYAETHDGWTSEIPNIEDIPMGLGYGPAEVRANLGVTVDDDKMQAKSTPAAMNPRLFDGSSLATDENPRVFMLAGGRRSTQLGTRPGGSRFTEGTPTPDLPTLEGKYGEKAPFDWRPPVESIQLNEWAGDYRFARPGTANDTRRWSDKTQVLDSGETHHDRRVPFGTAVTDNLGIPAVWWDRSGSFNWHSVISGASRPRQIFNSPPDLHGRMKSTTLAASGNDTVPHLVFAKPEWFTGSNGRRFTEVSDDPYELRLDSFISRGGRLHDPATDGTNDPEYDLGLAIKSRDNPFTLAELEAVLRPYDIDTRLAPHRLAAILGSAAEEMRLRVTTDSWDTTAIVGGGASGGPAAAKRLDTFVNGLTGDAYGSTTMGGHTRPISGAIAHEVSRGERFDLNRPLVGAEAKPAIYDATAAYYVQRQAYCKDLYTLLVALDPSADKAMLAQWAVNFCDFRDADSVMTPFEYDTNPANGWDVDGDPTTSSGEQDRAFVWGAERPEMLITETYAWEDQNKGGLFIMLHRPWRATAYANSTTAIAGEPIDTLFEEDPTDPENTLDLTKEVSVSGSATKLPVWRLRIVSDGATRYVRFNETHNAGGGSPPPADFVPASNTTAALFKRGAGTWLMIRPDETTDQATVALEIDGVTPKADTITINSQPLKAPGTAAELPANVEVAPDQWPQPRECRVYLERLTDPSCQISNGDDANVWPGSPKDSNPPDGLPRYRVVDEAPVQVVNRRAPPMGTNHSNYQNATLVRLTRQTSDVGGKDSAFWRADDIEAGGYSHLTPTHFKEEPFQTLGPLATGATRWFAWPNRPVVSAAELLLVPRRDSLSMLHAYEAPSASNQGTVGVPIALSLLLDAVHVPTRFIGIHGTYRAAATAALDNIDSIYESNTGINTLITTINQLSSFREPGRVNINTIPSADIWNAVVGGPLAEGVLAQGKTRTAVAFATTPAQTLAHALALNPAADPAPFQDNYSGDSAALTAALARNPMHRFYTANRLANTVTIRSNVFAVWITLRTSVKNDPDSVKFHRAFAIIDRSIPVGFLPGKDLNARDTVRLWRVIE